MFGARGRSHIGSLSRPPSGRCEVRVRLRELAAIRRRFWYRRLQILVAREGIIMNHKKLRRSTAKNGYRCADVAVANVRSAQERR